MTTTPFPATDPRWAPVEVAPSGRYGFTKQAAGLPMPERGPIVQLVQLCHAGTDRAVWAPTPARFDAYEIGDLLGELAIDLGAAWRLSEADTAAFAAFARSVIREEMHHV